MVSNVYRCGLMLFLSLNLILDCSTTFSNWIVEAAGTTVFVDSLPAARPVAAGASRLGMQHSRKSTTLAIRFPWEPFSELVTRVDCSLLCDIDHIVIGIAVNELIVRINAR